MFTSLNTYIGTGSLTSSQALWLQQAYQLEFLGKSTFVPGLWLASIVFFLINIWILGIIITDVGRLSRQDAAKTTHKKWT